MKKTLVFIVMLVLSFGVASVGAEPSQFNPIMGMWRYDSPAATFCPCTITIRNVRASGEIEGQYDLANQANIGLTAMAKVSGNGKLSINADVGGYATLWLELSKDGTELSGTWEFRARRGSSARTYKRISSGQ